jgi:bifunctional UDP-N-acetylglucosamine pyrophosphorylase / glucosamine-1-phosphate N-acetyltransferase
MTGIAALGVHNRGMATRAVSALVLAAGEGTRMRSSLPKPLHSLCGRPMLLHVIDSLRDLPVDRVVVVVGYGAEMVTKVVQERATPARPVEFVDQRVQRGTGDAAAVGLTGLPEIAGDLDDADVVILPGDTPLLRPETINRLVRTHRASEAAATVLTARLPDPSGYGRIVRDKDGNIARVVEDTDVSDRERRIDEVSTSIYCFRRGVLAPALRRLSPDNAQGQYYLTDVLAVLHDAGYRVVSVVAADPTEVLGVNDQAQLAAAEAELRQRVNQEWMRRGVAMVDPHRTYLDVTVTLAEEVTLLPGVQLCGATSIGAGASVGPDTRLVDCVVGADAVVASTAGQRAEVGVGAQVGPYAVLEPGCRVAPGTVTGPFFRGQPEDEDERDPSRQGGGGAWRCI